jgi:hypothetical protein
MGLVLGSSVVIAAERRGDTVVAMLKQIASTKETSLLGESRFSARLSGAAR